MPQPVATESASAKPDYSAAAGTILKEYKGEKVLIITDGNHYRTQEVHDLAFATAAAGRDKGINGVGLEILPRSHQRLVDALAAGEISKQDFLDIYGASSSTHFDNTEKNKLFGSIADAVQGGTKVYAHGTMSGVEGRTDEQVAILEEIQTLSINRELDLAKFKRQNSAEIAADPKAFAEKLYAEADKKRNGMTPAQIEALDEVKKTMQSEPGLNQYNAETGYSDQIRELYNINHPTFTPIEELENKVGATPGYTQPERRQEQDGKISGYIKEDIPKDGSIIEVYGRLHTIHKKDLDANLRDSGISVMIVDPNRGPEDKMCAPIMPKDFCGVWPAVVDRINEDVKKDADPNRYEMPDFKKDPTNIKKLTPDEIKALMEKPDALRVSSATEGSPSQQSPAMKAQDQAYSV